MRREFADFLVSPKTSATVRFEDWKQKEDEFVLCSNLEFNFQVTASVLKSRLLAVSPKINLKALVTFGTLLKIKHFPNCYCKPTLAHLSSEGLNSDMLWGFKGGTLTPSL